MVIFILILHSDCFNHLSITIYPNLLNISQTEYLYSLSKIYIRWFLLTYNKKVMRQNILLITNYYAYNIFFFLLINNNVDNNNNTPVDNKRQIKSKRKLITDVIIKEKRKLTLKYTNLWGFLKSIPFYHNNFLTKKNFH